MPALADRFEFEADLRRDGTGGGGVGPLEVAAELGTGRRPDSGFSDKLRKAGAPALPAARSLRSIMVEVVKVWTEDVIVGM